jgi:hypothetical protein
LKRVIAIALLTGCIVEGPEFSVLEHEASVCAPIGYAGAVIDDGDPCFEAGGPAAAIRNVGDAGKDGDLVWTHATDDADEANFGQWSLKLEHAGRYRVEVYTDARYAESKQAKYVVRAAGTNHDLVLDQTAADDWQALGEVDFAQGADQWVRVADNTGEPLVNNVQLVFDALRVLRVEIDTGSDSDAEPPSGGGCAVGGTSGVAMIALLAGLRRRRKR